MSIGYITPKSANNLERIIFQAKERANDLEDEIRNDVVTK